MLKACVKNLFVQIEEALQLITTESYQYKNGLMGNATIGQHTRHIIELFEEMIKGYELGTINYENRQRNFFIETNKEFAVTQMKVIVKAIDKEDKNILLSINGGDNSANINSTYFRELLYNIEHTIHHMALIRIAFKSAFNIELNTEFGVAPSTIKYKQQCAQ
jgi:hypothetical protein